MRHEWLLVVLATASCGGNVEVSTTSGEGGTADTSTGTAGSGGQGGTSTGSGGAIDPCDVNYWAPIVGIQVDSSNYQVALDTFLDKCPEYNATATDGNQMCEGQIPEQEAQVFCNNLPGNTPDTIWWNCPLLLTNSGMQGFIDWGSNLTVPHQCALTFSAKQ